MRISRSRIAYLLNVYSDGRSTTEEEQELFKWVAEEGKEAPIKKHLEELVESYNSNDALPEVNWEQLYDKILEEKNSRYSQPALPKKIGTRWVAAAAVIIMMGTGYYFLTAADKEEKNLLVIEQPRSNDVAPPNTVNAVLTLSNGQTIILDSAGNGTVATQGSVQVMKLANGEIAYQGSSNEIEYNTLSNPRGSKIISLLLADGSRVWLNTESSLRFPTAFTGRERNVEITGEAYFEVAHNPGMPFRVSKGTTTIHVLGTHFNVKAYDDESSLNITLLEGSVRVAAENNQEIKVIEPGEQAQVNRNGSIKVDNSISLNEVMAWKNELFLFEGVGMRDIMREVSRWYGVEVVFEKPIEEKFYAEVSRNTSVSTLLKMLEATKAVRFKIEGKTITVMP